MADISKNKVSNFIILGAPGSGKDTQVKELQKKFRLELISTGDIARELAGKDPAMEKIIESGELLPDEKFLKGLEYRIKNVSEDTGFILDGFPRTLRQVDELEKILFHIGRIVDNVIYLNVPEEKLIDRLSKRYICSKCDYVSSIEENCPNCGRKMEKRADDKPSVTAERITVYLDKTIPVVQYYQSKGQLIEIDGDQSVENVTRDIFAKLD